MEKKLFNLFGMSLPPEPLVYLHEYFKEQDYGLPNNWVWFSRQDLQNILNSIDALTSGANTGDGVRLYHGVYNQQLCDYLDHANPGTSYQDHLDQSTVFFVPTYRSAHAEHIDNISQADAARIRADYENGVDLPIPWAGGFDVGTICPPYTPPATSCARSGSNL
jgi:hypothetical protein